VGQTEQLQDQYGQPIYVKPHGHQNQNAGGTSLGKCQIQSSEELHCFWLV
jgi:hypothetical protein